MSAAILESLDDAGLTFADASLDVRGWTVTALDDSDSARVRTVEMGRVETVVVDARQRSVRYLEVADGGFFGVGRRRRLVSVEAIVGLDRRRIWIAADEGDLPPQLRYRPELVECSFDDVGLIAYPWALLYPGRSALRIVGPPDPALFADRRTSVDGDGPPAGPTDR